LSQEVSKKLPTKVRIMMVGIALSAIGNGLVLPYTFIYFNTIRGIPTAVAGLIIGYGALASLVISPLVGNMVDKWGPKPVLIVALLVSATGYASLGLIRNASQAILVITICSFGQSAMWPSQNAISTELTPEHLRERIYGVQFAMLNLGIGIGGLISSLAVTLDNARSFELLFFGDGISYLVYLVAVLLLGNVGRRTKKERAENAALDQGWREVMADKTFVKLWFVAIAAIFLGYSQMEVGYTAFSTSISGMQPRDLAWAYATNTLLIAFLQLWVIKILERTKRKYAIVIAAVIWSFAWVSLAISGLINNGALIFVIGCQFIFAIGEMVWSPILPSVVNQLAPNHLRGRYNAAATNTWQIAMVAGPAVAGTLLGAKLHWFWLVGLMIGLLLVATAALRLKLPDRPIKSKK
jgi:MFS family permease